jgi:septal ring factor EnvC (AmiA/AmiB activator)
MASAPPDRVWRVARWVIAVPVLIASLIILVISGFALYYAKKASDQDVRAGALRSYASIRRQLNEAEDVLRQARAAADQAREDAARAREQMTAAAKRTDAVHEEIVRANALLAENAESKQEIAKELDAISKQLTAIEAQFPKAPAG